MQKERLTDEFSTVLTNFQTAQRTAAEKERASVQRARAYSGLNQVSIHRKCYQKFYISFLPLLPLSYKIG